MTTDRAMKTVEPTPTFHELQDGDVVIYSYKYTGWSKGWSAPTSFTHINGVEYPESTVILEVLRPEKETLPQTAFLLIDEHYESVNLSFNKHSYEGISRPGASWKAKGSSVVIPARVVPERELLEASHAMDHRFEKGGRTEVALEAVDNFLSVCRDLGVLGRGE